MSRDNYKLQRSKSMPAYLEQRQNHSQLGLPRPSTFPARTRLPRTNSSPSMLASCFKKMDIPRHGGPTRNATHTEMDTTLQDETNDRLKHPESRFGTTPDQDIQRPGQRQVMTRAPSRPFECTPVGENLRKPTRIETINNKLLIHTKKKIAEIKPLPFSPKILYTSSKAVENHISAMILRRIQCSLTVTLSTQEALAIYKDSPVPFDIVVMGIFHPKVEDEWDSIQGIRDWEKEVGLLPCKIVVTRIGSRPPFKKTEERASQFGVSELVYPVRRRGFWEELVQSWKDEKKMAPPLLKSRL